MEDFSVKQYFQRFAERFGDGWTRFWYTPSDTLPLSMMRIGAGLVALYFLLTYTFDVAYFFQNGGLLPVELTRQYQPSDAFVTPSSFSYLSYLDSPTELLAAHWLGVLVMVLFTVGFYSRVTSVLALIVTLSYIHRAPLVTSEIEPVLAMLQLYLCLGPCGNRLSIDRWLAVRRAEHRPATLERLKTQKFFSATVATRLIQVHLCLAVLMMGLAKVSGPGVVFGADEWYDPWGIGEAVWLMLARPQSWLFDMTFLRDYPKLVAAWTHGIVLFELAFPIFVWNRLARPLMLGIGIVVWSSLALISGLAVLYVLLFVASFSFYSPALLHRWLVRVDRPVEAT